MKPNKKQIESVSALPPIERYKHFIKRFADFEECWSIVDEDGELVILEVDDYKFISLWSSKEYIEMDENLGTIIPNNYTLEYFQQTLFDFIEKNNLLINVFSIKGKTGFIVSLGEFVRDLNEELSQYD